MDGQKELKMEHYITPPKDHLSELFNSYIHKYIFNRSRCRLIFCILAF